MAIYQFPTLVIPPDSWSNINPNELIDDIDAIISRATWCNSTIWKSEEEPFDHDVSINLNEEETEIEDFRFRNDLRDQNLEFLNAMLALCAKRDLRIKSHDGESISPNLKEYIALAQNSKAFNFLDDQYRFLTELL